MWAFGLESFVGPLQKVRFIMMYGAIIDFAFGEGRREFQVGFEEEVILDQEFRADEQWIPRKGGDAAVGRVIMDRIGGVQGKNLPESLLSSGQKIHELVGPGSDVPDAERGGKGGPGEQKA